MNSHSQQRLSMETLRKSIMKACCAAMLSLGLMSPLSTSAANPPIVNSVPEAKTAEPVTANNAVATTDVPAAPTFADFHSALKGLTASDFTDKQAALEAMGTFNHPSLEPALIALSEGLLFADSKGQFITQDKAGEESYHSLTTPDTKVDKTADFKKISINNNMRQWLKTYIAEHALISKDPAKRVQAMQQFMAQSDDEKLVAQVQGAMTQEKDDTVRQLMSVFLAKHDLSKGDTTAQAKAIDILSNTADLNNKAALEAFSAITTDGALRQAAQTATKNIERKVAWAQWAETLSFGLSLGSVLVLAAIGLSITFGVMGVINMAHGELMMIGAYCAYVIQQALPQYMGASILIAIPVAFIVSGLVGVLIERLVVRHLYGRPLETLLATFGVSLILQQTVRTIFSPLNRMVQTPDWMSGSWQILPTLALTWNRVYIIGFSLLCFGFMWLMMNKTRLGLEVRAVAQNRDMAKAMGISSHRVDMMTFALGSGIAGVAGVALSQLTNVGPNLGQSFIVDSFMVVVVGGVGNLWGTLVSGLALGIFNKLFEPWVGAVLAKILMLVFIILFIQKYPRGLFPQKGRAAGDE